jgi:PPOX class probable F420-dependent enzyme
VPSKHALSRLKKDHVIWFTTCGREGQPHAVPVWFWWDGKAFLIYSVPGQKVRDIEGNPKVNLHLNTDSEGNDVVRVDGTARVATRQAPAHKVPAYIRKYRDLIKGFDWTPKVFSDQYHVAIRVRPTRFYE